MKVKMSEKWRADYSLVLLPPVNSNLAQVAQVAQVVGKKNYLVVVAELKYPLADSSYK